MDRKSKSLQEDLWALLDIQNELEEIQEIRIVPPRGSPCGVADCMSDIIIGAGVATR